MAYALISAANVRLPPPPPGIRAMDSDGDRYVAASPPAGLSAGRRELAAQRITGLDARSTQTIEPFPVTYQRVAAVAHEEELLSAAHTLPRPLGDRALRQQLAELDELTNPFRAHAAIADRHPTLRRSEGSPTRSFTITGTQPLRLIADLPPFSSSISTAAVTVSGPVSLPTFMETQRSARATMPQAPYSLASASHTAAYARSLGMSGMDRTEFAGRLAESSAGAYADGENRSNVGLAQLLEQEQHNMRRLRMTLSAVTGSIPATPAPQPTSFAHRAAASLPNVDLASPRSPPQGMGVGVGIGMALGATQAQAQARPATTRIGLAQAATGQEAGPSGATVGQLTAAGSLSGSPAGASVQGPLQAGAPGPASSPGRMGPAGSGQTAEHGTTLVVSGSPAAVERLNGILEPLAGECQRLVRTLMAGAEFVVLLPPQAGGAGLGTPEMHRPTQGTSAFDGHASSGLGGRPSRRRIRMVLQPDLRTVCWTSAGRLLEGQFAIPSLVAMRIASEAALEGSGVYGQHAEEPDTRLSITVATGPSMALPASRTHVPGAGTTAMPSTVAGGFLASQGGTAQLHLLGPSAEVVADWVAGLTLLHDMLPA